jgi:hypothetical protein
MYAEQPAQAMKPEAKGQHESALIRSRRCSREGNEERDRQPGQEEGIEGEAIAP